jgi:hypothetical protein
VVADDDGWGQHSGAAAEAERAMGIAALLAAGLGGYWHLSGASCGGGALGHGDRAPRALGGGQGTAEACGVAWVGCGEGDG